MTTRVKNIHDVHTHDLVIAVRTLRSSPEDWQAALVELFRRGYTIREVMQVRRGIGTNIEAYEDLVNRVWR